MATIYSDQHRLLKDLLASAGKSDDATLLIPDLQRPYVWEPAQVIALVDSLIRGWPFGTLLTWKVKSDDPIKVLARSFWRIVDRTSEDDGESISMKNPPAKFHMVLDGQQRVQSLLLAFGGDGWGFKLLDRRWHESLSGTKPRGPRGKPHWSLGCLCVDVIALSHGYAQTRRANNIDYTNVLKWVVTDDANGQSKLSKPQNYVEPLPKASASAGQFVRLSRLWEVSPEQTIDPYEAEDLANSILVEHGVQKEHLEQQKRPVGALLLALTEVKKTRVTYLELAEHEEAISSREVYNDAVVNIFTRLNTAGRTLTREDITFAWLKVGWNTDCTGGRGAKTCVEDITRELGELKVPISVEDVISIISFVWAVTFNSGKLLTNQDLVKGEAIRPMAANVSENWDLIIEAGKSVCNRLLERGLKFGEHYQSVNALAYLWGWYFAGLAWCRDQNFRELETDSFDKNLEKSFDLLADRWLICSQWAGVWTSAREQSLTSFAVRLYECRQALTQCSDINTAVDELTQRFFSEIKKIEQDAIAGLTAVNADDRQQVRGYYVALWLWNRLEKDRWEMAKLALRQNNRKQNAIEVDHIVPFSLWESKLKSLQEHQLTSSSTVQSIDELSPLINELGNTMLLEKNFNISKNNKSLKEFLENVHEFKEGEVALNTWVQALQIEMPQVDCENTSADVLRSLFADRTLKIRGDLEQFIRGAKSRVDLDP